MTIKAMILAAGRGERMRPLTDITPKPLLEIAGKRLIDYRIEALVQAGIHDIVINVSYQADRLMDEIGDGARYGASIEYSIEKERLETGGGIVKALSLLSESFIIVNSDIWTDFDFSSLLKLPLIQEPHSESNSFLAHLILVDNPAYHPHGDLELHEGIIYKKSQEQALAYTYSGIAVYQKKFFAQVQTSAFRVTQLWSEPMQKQQMSGEYFSGQWQDIGAPERLEALRQELATRTVSA